MSERYSRLFSLPENLYAVGSPVVIAAGALLKDKQTGKVLAQLKLTNIQCKKIKAVKVKLFPQDTMGQPMGEAIDHQYLDLQLVRDGDFGSKTPILFPDATARAFTVEVTSVVFADNTAWNSDGSIWEPIPDRVALHQRYDNLVIEQLRLEQNGACQFVVQEHKDLWLCTCGAINHGGEAHCHNCGKQLSQIHPLDVAGLTERANLRLAEEARIAAEEKAAREAAAVAAKNKTVKILKVLIPTVCAVVAVTLLTTKVIIPNSQYNKAVSLMDAGQYEDAIAAFEAMDGYKDSAEQIVICENAIVSAEQTRIEEEKAIRYTEAETLAKNNELGKAAIAFAKMGDYLDARERSLELWEKLSNRKTIATGYKHSIGLKKDGTMVATGVKKDGRCNVSSWGHIVAIDAENGHTVGLKADGTVLSVGYNDDGQCNVSDWTNIVDIAAGSFQTIGLKIDGTAIAVGWNEYGQCDVSNWTDIVAISAGGYHTVGVKADGTVVSVGNNDKGQCNTSGWTNIVAISAGKGHTVGLKADGTVVATGWNDNGQCNVSGWTNIVAISAVNGQTVGLKADGTVLAVGYNEYAQCDTENWTDIVAVSAGSFHTIGLKADGTMVAAGWNDDGQCNVSGWKSIKFPN